MSHRGTKAMPAKRRKPPAENGKIETGLARKYSAAIKASKSTLLDAMEGELFDIGMTLDGWESNISAMKQRLLALHEGLSVIANRGSKSKRLQ